MKTNEIKHGFKLVNEKYIKDIDSTLYEYEHIKSGASLVYLANEDTNCSFTIGFKTLPNDSTGVCHIIEHSVLSGSEKYPLKEPFLNLIKSSMASFLNAFTSRDWTMYPFATQNQKDFDNILSVYCDAVFRPISMKDPKPFLQEGWHLEMNSVDDTPLYKGVVYNEMKGAMSSVDEVLSQTTFEALYKDTRYANNSGGDPDAIPTLTYEAYKDFYHSHYTPENSMTYFYGKLDIDSKLEFLDKEYFSKYEKLGNTETIDLQKPLINLDVVKEYELGDGESVKDNAYMSIAYALCESTNLVEMMAFNVLSRALFANNESPIKKALLDAKLAQDVSVEINDANILPSLNVNLKKTSASKKEEFRSVFINSIKELINSGIDKELLLSVINATEFETKEMDTGAFPKGIVICMEMMKAYNYGIPYEKCVEYTAIFNELKKGLESDYFEKLLEKYIINSNHYVQVVLMPSKTLGAKKKNEMDQLMQHFKDTMSMEEKENVVKMNQELIAYQTHIETKEELACLPTVKSKDISKEVNYINSKKAKLNGISCITHTLNTNNIAYLSMYFDINTIAFEDLPYVELLTCLLTTMPTKNYDVVELNKKLNTYLGKFRSHIGVYSTNKNEYSPKLIVDVSSLEENISYIPKFVNEILLNTKFVSKLVKQKIVQLTNDLKMSIIQNGTVASTNIVRETTSKVGVISSSINGIRMYNFVCKLLENYDSKKVIAKLKEVSKMIFTKKNVMMSLSGSIDIINKLSLEVKSIKLPRKEVVNRLEVNLVDKINEALVIPSGVSYSSIGINIEDVNETFNGKYEVMANIARYDYLWSEVRVKGGAYGARVTTNKSNEIILGSYRDPNVANTYNVYYNFPNYLKNFNPSIDEFDSFIVGAYANYFTPLSIPATIKACDIDLIRGLTKKDKQQFLREMLSTKIDDIRGFAKTFEELLPNASYYTVGNVDKIKEYKFDKVNNL